MSNKRHVGNSNFIRYAAGFSACGVAVFAFAVLSVLIGIPTGGIGFIVVQVILWGYVIPATWRQATARFENAEPPDLDQAH